MKAPHTFYVYGEFETKPLTAYRDGSSLADLGLAPILCLVTNNRKPHELLYQTRTLAGTFMVAVSPCRYSHVIFSVI